MPYLAIKLTKSYAVSNACTRWKTKGWFTRSDIRIRFLLKFKEVNDVKQHFYELKQCQLKKTDPKIGSCEPAFREVSLSVSSFSRAANYAVAMTVDSVELRVAIVTS